ncbi:FecR family protein [Parapedobacter sp. 10938]|uniref:FecR family protein n=1 Tax=Parapedobacter flavus TaxID=3110225 RepID=UPI002DBC126C|nr:FecR domain-containing protein [Parapedobacter sp. 10938]MEC3880515.1 FecR domain-containing protein [Parapedobacter sp. 10938]
MERKPPYNHRIVFGKFLDGRCNEEEMRWLLDYFGDAAPDDLGRLVREALEEIGVDNAISAERQAILDGVHRKLSAAIGNTRQPASRSIIRRIWPYAAAVVMMLSVGIYWLGTGGNTHLVSRYGGDVQPGTNRATLAFADGRSIHLSEAQQGIVVGEGIRYLDGSAVSEYGTADNRLAINEQRLTTPNGGTYSVTLSDGTKVWLNAASTLQYPARFSGPERIVTLEGEAFFDVKRQTRGTGPNKSKIPFRVITNGQTVEVLGTTFGISAYPNEETKTTLVEGAVRLRPDAGGSAVSLTPGEQGVLATAGSIAKHEVNVSTHTAWKDGLIVLKGASVSTVVKQIERWYDVEFVGASGLTVSGALSGELPRGIRLSEILQALEMHVDATFKIEGRRVFVER